MPNLLSDAALLNAIRNDDASAFKELYDRYWQRIYLKACQRVDKDTAKDMVQEVMTTLWRRRKEVDLSEEGAVGRYLFTAIKYRVISQYAYSHLELKNSHLLEGLDEHITAQSLEVKELSAFIDQEVSRLPSRMQQVFRMSREEELSIADIAQSLNVSEQTVKNQLTEALKRLRTSLSAQDSSGRTFVLFLLLYFCLN